MRKQISLYAGIIILILCSNSYCLPPSLVSLNDLIDTGEYQFGFRSIIQDGANNLIVYFTKYDSTMLMNVYRFRINTAGEVIEDPHVILPLIGMYDDFKVMGDKDGRSYLIAGFFMSNSCDWDAAYEVDPSGEKVTSVATRPPGDLSCSNILYDSIFIATRIGDREGCWNEIDYNTGVLYLQVFWKNPSDSATNLINLPILIPGFYPVIIQPTSEDKILVIADDAWRTRYYYYNKKSLEAKNFASYIIDLDDQTITNPDSGGIIARSHFKVPGLYEGISIYGPSSIWVNDKLLYYFRLPPYEYYEGNVNDTLCILIFDKNGKRIDTGDEDVPVVAYKSVDRFGSTEQLIPLLIRTADKKWKRKFGLISFKDFPWIYIDLGEN